MGLFGFGKKKDKPDKVTVKTEFKTEFTATPTFITHEKNPKKAQKMICIAEEQKEVLDKAKLEYRKNRNAKACISAYKKILDKKLEWNPIEYELFLSQLYRETKDYNTAWSMLNKMLHDRANDVKRFKRDAPQIIMEQARIAEAEKKYESAIELYMRSFYLNNYEYGNVSLDSFIRCISDSATQLKLSPNDVNELGSILNKFVMKKSNDEEALIKQYRKFMSKR